jgi:hypothetical protein
MTDREPDPNPPDDVEGDRRDLPPARRRPNVDPFRDDEPRRNPNEDVERDRDGYEQPVRKT